MKRTMYICMLIAFLGYIPAACITGIFIYFYPQFSDFSYGIIGLLAGLFIGIGASVFNRYQAKKNPEYQKKVRIDSTDERLVSIRHASGNLAWKITILILCAYTVFLSFQRQRTHIFVLVAIIGISLTVYAISLLWLNNEK